MRDLMAELKELRLHGMATAWAELTAQGESNTASSKWLLEHLLEQEHTDRAMRSVSHQMNMAKLPAFCKVVVASAVFLSCYFHCRLLPLWVECDGADRLPISRCT